MQSVPKEVVREFILDMTPHDGAAGVDVESAAYADMLEGYAADYDVSNSELDNAVRDALRRIGSEGFGEL